MAILTFVLAVVLHCPTTLMESVPKQESASLEGRGQPCTAPPQRLQGWGWWGGQGEQAEQSGGAVSPPLLWEEMRPLLGKS